MNYRYWRHWVLTSVAPSATCGTAGLRPSFTNTVFHTSLGQDHRSFGQDALDLPRRTYVVQHDRDVETTRQSQRRETRQEKNRVRSKQKEYLAVRKSTYGKVGGVLIGMPGGSCSLRVSRDNHIHMQLVWCLYRCRSNYVTLSCSQYRTVVYRGGGRSRNTRLKPLSDKAYTTMINLGRSCVCQ